MIQVSSWRRALALRQGVAVVALTAALAGLAVFVRSSDAPFVFDDVVFAESAVVQVGSIRELAPLFSMEGVPRKLTMATFAANFLVGGLHPRGYHLVNLALHVVNALAVFALLSAILRRWPDEWWASRARHIAWAGALLWLVHPVQTQAVVYTWQRATLLCACFYLWTLVAYIAGRGRAGWPRLFFYALALGLGLLALLTKENAATLPAAVLLIEWYVFRPALGWRVAAGAGVAIVALLLIAGDYLGPRYVEMMRQEYARRGFTPVERLLTESRVVVGYIGLLAYPHPSRLNLDYDVTLSRTPIDPPATAVALLAIGALLAVACRGLGSRTLLSLAVFWFLVNLAIESTIVPLDLAYEHRLYLPSVLPVVLGYGLVRRLLGESSSARVAVAAAGLLLAAWSVQRLEVWRDPVRLWTDNAVKSPNKARVFGNLGKACLAAADAPCAERAFSRAIAIDPRLDAASNGLATVLLDYHRDYEGTERLLSSVLERSPDFVPALVNLGVLQLRTGRAESAARTLEQAARREPNDRGALSNLATALIALRRLDEADAVLGHALRVWPFDARLLALKGLALFERGDRDRARGSVTLALAANPHDGLAQEVSRRLDAAR